MIFWLYDPKSFKNAALFPTGGLGNFLNTLTIIILSTVALLKTKFTNMVDDKTLYIYTSVALLLVTGAGLLFGKSEESSNDSVQYNFDLTYE